MKHIVSARRARARANSSTYPRRGMHLIPSAAIARGEPTINLPSARRSGSVSTLGAARAAARLLERPAARRSGTTVAAREPAPLSG